MTFFKKLKKHLKETAKRNLEARKKFVKEEAVAKQILHKKVLQAKRKATELETLKQIKKEARAKVKAEFDKKKAQKETKVNVNKMIMEL